MPCSTLRCSCWGACSAFQQASSSDAAFMLRMYSAARASAVQPASGVFRSASADAPTFNDRQLAAKLRQRDRLTPRKTI